MQNIVAILVITLAVVYCLISYDVTCAIGGGHPIACQIGGQP